MQCQYLEVDACRASPTRPLPLRDPPEGESPRAGIWVDSRFDGQDCPSSTHPAVDWHTARAIHHGLSAQRPPAPRWFSGGRTILSVPPEGESSRAGIWVDSRFD